MPKRIENGLCPRCDLGNEGVDLSRVRFYKPEKLKRDGGKSPRRPGSRSSRSGVDIRGESPRKILKTNAYGCSPKRVGHAARAQKQLYHSHSIQSLPNLRTRAYSPSSEFDHNRDGGYISSDTSTCSDKELSKITRHQSSSRRCSQVQLTWQARRWWHRRLNRRNHSSSLQANNDSPPTSPALDSAADRDRRRDRLKSALKGMVAEN